MRNHRNTAPILRDQVTAIFKHVHIGSIVTRRAYLAVALRFVDFIGEEFGLLKLKNLDERHLTAYVIHLQQKGLSASTVKKEISAIRYLHDQVSGAQNRLPSNDELSVELERRMFSDKDRAWSQDEFLCIVSVSIAHGFPDYACACVLGRYVGMRISEVFRLDRNTAEKAIKAGEIAVKGKGGLIRTVPLCTEAKKALQYMMRVTPRGRKLFVPNHVRTHSAINRLETFIAKHRGEVLDPGDIRNLTFHGLRHRFASDAYMYYRDKGYDRLSARLKVARLIGHNRDDVTNIYIKSAKKEGY